MNAKEFLIEHSGLQKSTVENSFRWVVSAMEAWDKHIRQQPSGGKSVTEQPVQGYSREQIIDNYILSKFGDGNNTLYLDSEQLREALRYAMNYEFTQQPVNDGWVRVEDGLPEYGMEVDVYKLYHNKVDTAIRLSTNSSGNAWSCSYGHYITHWRLRPEPPKKL